MKFNLERTSDYTFGKKKTVEISSLKELLELVDKEGDIIIIPEDDFVCEERGFEKYTIEIYDTYRE